MNKNLRKPVIAGNWKMNKTPDEAKKIIAELTPLVQEAKCDVVLCVPFIDIHCALKATKGTNVSIGAQNCHFEESGAFTGEVSAKMLSSIGVKYVIIGHSERRAYFAETDVTVNKKLKAALHEGLKVILCVGETLEQRQHGITNEVISIQVTLALNGIKKEDLQNIIIAYEPVWAIGTGKTASSEEAEEVCNFIRNLVKNIYNDADIASKSTILYGGSMNTKNAKELLFKDDIDGGLIGGASLKAVDFSEIVNATN